MIEIPTTKILFIDIETVGCCPDFDSCESLNPTVAKQFTNYFDWFLKRFPEDNIPNIEHRELLNTVFKKRAALVPEFAKIVCVSVAFVSDKGEIKKQSFSSDIELEILKPLQMLLDKCGKLDFYLCGHNLKNFDIPMIAKRMIINGLKPPSLLPSYNTKPWEIKAIDTKEVWQYGSYTSIGSLDLLCSVMDIPSSKDGEITGDKVHSEYWTSGKLSQITEYCERDVEVLIDIIKKLKDLKK